MSDGEFQLDSREPSEAELRTMLEEREREKDLARNETSRKFSRILIISAVVLTGAIFFYPAKPLAVAPARIAKAVIAAPMPTPLNPDPTNSDPAMVEDLKPFTPRPGAKGGDTEDVRFAVQLLNFMDAADLKTVIPAKESEPVKEP
jgi:hypothetical protein